MAFPGGVTKAGVQFVVNGLSHLLDEDRKPLEAVGFGNGVRTVEGGMRRD